LTEESVKTSGKSAAVRTSQEIATRALALFSVVGLGLGADRTELLTWLRDENLYAALTPVERALLTNKAPTRQQLKNASWQSEALLVLLWTLEKVDELPPPDTECDTALFQQLLPPYADVSVKDFIQSAGRRSEKALTDMAEKILKLHWQARQTSTHDTVDAEEINVEIVQEWHRAINWVIGYEGLAWDKVTTDT